MTYIKSFHIEGLAGRSEPVTHTLDRHTNIFWGLNGTGKTTVLRVLEAALKNRTRGLDSMPFRHAVVTFHSDNIDRDLVRTYVKGEPTPESRAEQLDLEDRELFDANGWVTGYDEVEDEDPGWRTEILGGPLPESAGITEARAARRPYVGTFLPISRVVSSGRVPRSRHGADDAFVERINRVWRQYSAESLAEIEAVQRQGFASVLAILFGGRRDLVEMVTEPSMNEQTVDAAEAYEVVSAFLSDQGLFLPLGQPDFERRYYDSIENQQVVARIQATNALVDEIRAPQREIQNVIDEMYVGNKHVVFDSGAPRPQTHIQVRFGSDEIPLRSLSSGEKQLLHILLETLAVGFSSILIDEPELSLHPDWQKRLVGSMRRVNGTAQFILASHSPDLMLHIPSECVFEL